MNCSYARAWPLHLFCLCSSQTLTNNSRKIRGLPYSSLPGMCLMFSLRVCVCAHNMLTILSRTDNYYSILSVKALSNHVSLWQPSRWPCTLYSSWFFVVFALSVSEHYLSSKSNQAAILSFLILYQQTHSFQYLICYI